MINQTHETCGENDCAQCSQLDPPKMWYRYEEVRYAPPVDASGEYSSGPGTLEVRLNEYPVIKLTPKGVWLDVGFCGSHKRFVLKDARKRWACPTKDEALTSFIARKERQARILKHQLDTAYVAINIAKSMLPNQPKPVPYKPIPASAVVAVSVNLR